LDTQFLILEFRCLQPRLASRTGRQGMLNKEITLGSMLLTFSYWLLAFD
jgi:hypothetical protein